MFRVDVTADGLVLQSPDGPLAPTLSWRWVRDHGEDPASFDQTTRQRRVDALGDPGPKAALSADLTTVDGRDVVAIEWPEAPTSTWISCATLESLLSRSEPFAPALWHDGHRGSAGALAVDVYEVNDVLADDAVLAAWLTDISNVGFARLRGFAGGHDEAAQLARRIGYARSTIFGPTWDLSSEISDHDDTAYSQSFLAPHTDGTYSHDAPGLQMFSCIDRSGTGGESIVVDGFAAAETLRTDFPADFDVLTRVSVPGHYIEAGVELRAERPVLRVLRVLRMDDNDDDGRVVQISLNNYDRSPMLLPPDEMAAFYRAYARIHDIVNDRDRWHIVRLERGDVLINDNWRVLHGRNAYTGARHFVGCYLNHEDFESRCRTLGVATVWSR